MRHGHGQRAAGSVAEGATRQYVGVTDPQEHWRMPIEQLRRCLETGEWDRLANVYAPDALLDANVPQWRFKRKGIEAIVAQYRDWYPEPVQLVEWMPTPHGLRRGRGTSGVDGGGWRGDVHPELAPVAGRRRSHRASRSLLHGAMEQVHCRAQPRGSPSIRDVGHFQPQTAHDRNGPSVRRRL